jgi:MFS family permease
VSALLLVDFADEWLTFLPAASADAIRSDLGLSVAQTSAVLVLLSAGGIVGNFFTLAADFVSRRALAGFGALGYGLCMIAFGTGRSFAVLAVAAFAWGAASDAFVHGSQLALADLAGDELEPTLASTNLLASIGAFLAPVCVAGAETAGIGWRPLVVGGGAAMLGYAAWLGAESLPPPPRSDRSASAWAGVRAVTGDRWVRRLAAINALGDIFDVAFLGFLTVFLVEHRGLSAAGAASTVALALGSGTVTYLVLATITNRPGARAAFVMTSAVRVAGVALLVLVAHPVVVAFTVCGLGVGGAVYWVTLQASMLRARPGQTGTTYAVIATLSLPALAVPPLIGAAADRFGVVVGLGLYGLVPLALLLVVALPPAAQLRSLGACPRSSPPR